jgi:NAD(P)-dependent dehydrogenase (short-subunit alcohol dehydrogenase family)
MTGMVDDRRNLVASVVGDGALVPAVREALGSVAPGLVAACCVVPRVPGPALLAELDDDRLDREVGDALAAVLDDVQRAVATFAAGGRLVFVLPHAPLLGTTDGAAASAVTNGVLSMARTLAIELARDGVTVNVIAVDGDGPSERALAAELAVLLGDAGGDVTGQEIYLTAGTDLGRLRP